MKLKAVIVDDELKSRESLKNILIAFCEDVEVAGTCQNVEEGLEVINKVNPDVVFLDIRMQGETGFDLLARLESVNFEIIFTTAYSEYAIKAIKYSALDYLLKPIDIEDLINAVAKIRNKNKGEVVEQITKLLQNTKTNNHYNYNLALPTVRGLTFIRVNEAMYLKAMGNYTEIFMKDGTTHLVSRHLKEYDDILSEQNFCRIHHSTIININFIKEYIRGDGGSVIMTNGQSLDVSKRKKDSFLVQIGYKM